MEIFINILRRQIGYKFFKISETSLASIDTLEKRIVDVLLTSNKLLFLQNIGLNIFEVAGIQHFQEIVAMKIRSITIVP